MKAYIKTYMDFYGYDESSFIPCEVCGAKTVDVHHIRPKSLEKRSENKIENLIGLCRPCHEKAHKFHNFNEDLKLIHRKKMLQSKHDSGETIKYYNP